MTTTAEQDTALVVKGESAVASPLPMFRGAEMVQAIQAYNDLQRAIDQSMPDAIMVLDGKPFRKKQYWRAIAVAFNLTVEPIDERREVAGDFMDSRENFGYCVTYRATAGNGRSATGDGSCFAVEKARRFRCPHPERPGSKRTLHFPAEACPDFDQDYQWRGLPAQATEHNIRSHAHTRAFNRAVSNLVGFGEVSAEEVERGEMPPPTQTRPPQRPPQEPPAVKADTPDDEPRPFAPEPDDRDYQEAVDEPPPQQNPTRTSRVISEAQRRRMYAIARSAGMPEADYKAILASEFGVEDDRTVTRDAYENICKRLGGGF